VGLAAHPARPVSIGRAVARSGSVAGSDFGSDTKDTPAVLTKPGAGHRNTVLAEGALEPHRARAGEAKLLALGAKLDRVSLGALDGGASPSGACPQRTDPARFEIGKAALIGARRREAGDGGGGDRLRKPVWHAA